MMSDVVFNKTKSIRITKTMCINNVPWSGKNCSPGFYNVIINFVVYPQIPFFV